MAEIEGGKSQVEVARDFRVSRSTIQRIYKRFKEESIVRNKTKLGRPEKLIETEKQCIYRLALKVREIT